MRLMKQSYVCDNVEERWYKIKTEITP